MRLWWVAMAIAIGLTWVGMNYLLPFK